MTLNGPIIPKHAIVTPSLNPSTTTSSRVYEVITCPQTGRMWICTAATAGTYAYQQVLPYTRNDGTPSIVGTQIINNSGKMKVQNGTGSTAGEFNAFDKLNVNSSGTTIPFTGLKITGAYGLLNVNNTSNVGAITGFINHQGLRWNQATLSWEAGTPDITNSFTSRSTTDYSLTGSTGPLPAVGVCNIAAVASGTHVVTAHVLAYRSTAFQYSIGIQLRDNAVDDPTTTIYYPLATTVSGTGYVEASILGRISIPTTGNWNARLLVRSRDASAGSPITIKSNPDSADDFPFGSDYGGTDPATYKACTSMTFLKVNE
jgi:hypothetical protein